MEQKKTSQNLKENREDLVNKLKTLSKDAHATNTFLSDFESIVKQLAVEPTLVHIPISNKVEEIKKSAYTLTKSSGVIIFSMKGFKSIIYPTTPCYKYIEYLFIVKEMIEKGNCETYGLSEDEVEALYEDLSVSIPIILQYPTIAMTEPALMYGTSKLLEMFYEKTLEKAKEGLPDDASDDEVLSNISDVNELISSLKDVMGKKDNL